MEHVVDLDLEEDEFDELPEEKVSQDQNLEEGDLTSEILRLKGISDPEKIKFEDEGGAIVERSWDSLTKAEQLNILVGQKEEESEELDEEEIQLINTIRNSGMSPDLYIQSLFSLLEKPATRYEVEDFSDDLIYALDLLHKVGDNLSDEEISQAIEVAKLNEDLFKKTVEGLRKEYIRLQKELEELELNELAARLQDEYRRFSQSILNEINNLNSFAGQDLLLSSDDVEDLYSFILDLDSNGLSAFGKAMNNPQLFTKAAFWILNEDKIIEELSRQMLENYNKGYNQAKIDAQGKPKLAFKSALQQKKTETFVDEEDWY